jgi:hypothetical protein
LREEYDLKAIIAEFVFGGRISTASSMSVCKQPEASA